MKNVVLTLLGKGSFTFKFGYHPYRGNYNIGKLTNSLGNQYSVIIL